MSDVGRMRVVHRTRAAIGATLHRRDAGAILAVGTIGYLLAYSFAVGDLRPGVEGSVALQVVERPVSRMLMPAGFLTFEPVARLDAFGLTYLFSPIDAALAVALAVLVGANLALTYLGVVQPKACGLRNSTGVLAAVPALFSGAACCGPIIFVAVGIQATGALITGFRYLVPVAFVLLIGSLLLVGRQVEPELL